MSRIYDVDLTIGDAGKVTGTLTLRDSVSVPALLAMSDFKGGHYEIGSVTRALTDLWHQNLDWSTFDPANVIPGVGLRASPTDGSGSEGVDPCSTDELFAAINTPAGILAVVDYSLDQTDGGHAWFGLPTMDLPGYAEGWEYIDNDVPVGSRSVMDYTTEGRPDPSATQPSTIGQHRAAIQFAPGGLAFSVDGADPIEWVSAQANAARNALVAFVNVTGEATAILEMITFYSPVPVSALKQLSA